MSSVPLTVGRLNALRVNALAAADALAAFVRCGGSTRWANAMVTARPFTDDAALHARADAVWSTLESADILEAIAHHPRLGQDAAALRARFATTATWSAGEQAQLQAADEATLSCLQTGNLAYEARFGHTFIVCASGKPAHEILALLEARLPNDPATELHTASEELRKILHLRLDKP